MICDVWICASVAQVATVRRPDKNEYYNTLGVVFFRLGQWDDAIVALDRAIELNTSGATAFDLYFLAMCYERLGQSEKARSTYQSAGLGGGSAQSRPRLGHRTQGVSQRGGGTAGTGEAGSGAVSCLFNFNPRPNGPGEVARALCGF